MRPGFAAKFFGAFAAIALVSVGLTRHNVLADQSWLTSEIDIDRPGLDYRDFDLSGPRPGQCAIECAQDSKCKAYTYVKPGVQGQHARCWLKTEVPKRTSHPCCVSGVKLPLRPTQELPILIRWMDDVGLGDYFEVVGLYDYVDLAANGITPITSSVARDLFYVGGFRGGGSHQAQSMSKLFADQSMWSSLLLYPLQKLKDYQIPRYLLELRPRVDHSQLSALETEFEKMEGIALWERMLRKVSLVTQIPVRDIAIRIPANCASQIAAELSPGTAQRIGPQCAMQGAAKTLVLPNKMSHSLADPSSGAIDGAVLDFPAQVKRFLSDKFRGYQVNLVYPSTDMGYVEVVIKGLRGYVISGGSEWERIQMYFALQQYGSQTVLRVVADGSLASGMGDYPADSQFTKLMEPMHAEALTEFAKISAEEFQASILAQATNP